jgi:hypothetical protein
MRCTFLISVFFLLASTHLNAQVERTVDDILEQREIKKFNYTLTTSLYDAVVINMQFGESEVISNSDRQALKKADIFQVDLVFSDFPKDFDMTELNRRRIKVVQSLRKDAVTDPTVKWRLIRQMRCKNEAEAKVMFHGIVIHYRKEQSSEVSKVDYSYIERVLPTPFPGDSTRKEVKPLTRKEAKKIRKTLPDSTILRVLDRNKWDDMVVVSDMTGSMSPFIVQLVLWFKLNELDDRVAHVTFFNDGDRTPDDKKEVGRIGGIYHSESGEYDKTRDLALETISNGYGGDGPENDVEAILEAIERNPDAKEIVLIADNFAPIKDMSLIDKIDKPVRIVLCGSVAGVNIQYLELARKTKGSVHSMEKDLMDLAEMGEGKAFSLNGTFFKIVDGQITIMKPKKPVLRHT